MTFPYFCTVSSLAVSAWVTRDGARATFHSEVMPAAHMNAYKQMQAHPPAGPGLMPPAGTAFASARIYVFSRGLFDVARGRSCSGRMDHLSGSASRIATAGPRTAC